MQIAKFKEIKQIFNLKDDELYCYTVETDGTITIKKVNEYELLAEEGLKDVYDNEPERLWEQFIAQEESSKEQKEKDYWSQLAAEQFFADYTEEDEIYNQI
ncbi:MAG: hypothetical protein QNJ42_24860 [Crocosphaera sp.]|nr:hypothetical protein [Crocosphaera sp.]